MKENKLTEKKCVPCTAGTPPLAVEQQAKLLEQLPKGWKVVDNHHLEREFIFKDFKEALAFTNDVAMIAEEEGHHPDILLSWGKVKITLWTHKINGLSESDFILAAKISEL
jgi:4a-hydroxytetrahydrobiopterin dehydratase